MNSPGWVRGGRTRAYKSLVNGLSISLEIATINYCSQKKLVNVKLPRVSDFRVGHFFIVMLET